MRELGRVRCATIWIDVNGSDKYLYIISRWECGLKDGLGLVGDRILWIAFQKLSIHNLPIWDSGMYIPPICPISLKYIIGSKHERGSEVSYLSKPRRETAKEAQQKSDRDDLFITTYLQTPSQILKPSFQAQVYANPTLFNRCSFCSTQCAASAVRLSLSFTLP